MRPKKVAIDPDTVYQSRAPVRQQKFPARRSRAKQRQSLPARLEKQQSTLTQRWSFSSDIHDVEDDVEEIEDDDEEFEAERPTKRRRKTISGGKKGRRSLGERQNTMTQMGFVTSSFGPDMEKEREDTDEDETMLAGPDDPGGETEEDGEERVPESVSSQPIVSRRDMHARASRPATRLAKEPSAELPYTVGQPITPRKHFPEGTEIPSSNTPMSAVIFSASSRRTSSSPSKPPLLERSRHGLRSSGSVDVSPVRETPVKQSIAFSPYSARKTDIFRRPNMPASRVPKLKHRSTIPDSEDVPIEETQPTKSPRRNAPRRTLQRVRSTIQETQFEGLGQEITAEMEDDTQHDREDHTFSGTMDLSYPYYDTVAEALARDEDRYGQTQRLQGIRRHIRPGVVLDTQEGSDLDLLASRSQLGTAMGFSSLHDITRSINNRSGTVKHLAIGLPEDALSMHSQSPPATPSNAERTRHHPRFHDAEVVDLTADSFEPTAPILSGSPTPRTGSQAAIDVDRITSTPSRKVKHISSSPPLVRGHEIEHPRERVELLPLNDVGTNVAPLSSQRSDLDNGRRIPTSQVSTVGHLTQAFRTQRHRVRIKHEHEDPYSATLRVPIRDDYEDIDLDQEDEDGHEEEDVNIDDIVLSNTDLNAESRPIEHIDLSDHIELNPDDDDEHGYVNVDDIASDEACSGHEPTTPMPSSPLPAAPGHIAAEYDDVDLGEVSSDLAITIHDLHAVGSSQIEDMESLIERTSPGAHTRQGSNGGGADVTPRAAGGKAFQNRGDLAQDESTPRPLRLGISEKAKGKMACYAVEDSEEEEEEEEEEEGSPEEQHPTDECDDEQHSNNDEDDNQYSYHFRRANEILPDTQFSVLLPVPPVPSSSADEYFAPLDEGKTKTVENKRKRQLEDVSLTAPPKSSYGWRNRGKGRE